VSNRASDIQSKLAFALQRLRELGAEIQQTSASGDGVRFIGPKVGEILSACRECFDYAAKDLAEAYCAKRQSGTYFPFSEERLRSSVFSELQVSHPAIYACLFELARKVGRNAVIPNTHFGYRTLQTTNELVNAKKHDCITVANRRRLAATNVDFGNGVHIQMSPIYRVVDGIPDFGADVGAEELVGSHPDIKIELVPEYRLASNGWEASRYCRHTLEVSWRVLEELYYVAFSLDRGMFDPSETLKPPEQKRREAALKRASPIATRLVLVILRNADTTTQSIEIDFDGRAVSKSKKDMAIAKDMLDIFDAHVWPSMVARQYGIWLGDNIERLEREGYPIPHNNVITDFPTPREFKFSDGRPRLLLGIYWGFITRFRCDGCVPDDQIRVISGEMSEKAARLFELGQPKVVVGVNPIGSSGPTAGA
jgi:hypothetical protein